MNIFYRRLKSASEGLRPQSRSATGNSLIALALLSLVALPLQAQVTPPLRSLFDGKTLTNWKSTPFGDEGTVTVKEGMIVPGIITNLTNFGAFVDIGVKQDGLLHISQITKKYIQNPAEVLKLQQEISKLLFS